jgi:hypothetical protein
MARGWERNPLGPVAGYRKKLEFGIVLRYSDITQNASGPEIGQRRNDVD